MGEGREVDLHQCCFRLKLRTFKGAMTCILCKCLTSYSNVVRFGNNTNYNYIRLKQIMRAKNINFDLNDWVKCRLPYGDAGVNKSSHTM